MGEHERAISSSSDDEVDVPTRKRGLRGMLLQYMLYDAFVRPQSWAFAPLNNEARERHWREAIQRVCGETSGAVYVISNASELPSVPIFAASVIRDEGLASRFVNILEPRRPIAAALRACLKENNLDGLARVFPSSAAVFQPNRKAAEDAPGAVGKVLLVPGVEDIATLGSALEDLKDAYDNLLAAEAKVLPQSVSICAVGLTVPAQTDLVRAPLGNVSGFDLSPFNKFRGEAPVDLIRLRDIKSHAVTKVANMTNISLEEMNAVGELLRSSAFDAFELEMEVTSDGEITAIALWTECTMFDKVHSGGADQPSRRQMLSFLPKPLSVVEGSTVRLKGRYDASTGHFTIASSECSPDNSQTNSVVSMSVERWHFPMINDERRNSAYNRAIKVLRGQRVVDIGGGSGLLAMMAARAGAEQVVTVERVGDMAECASRVLEANGFGGKVSVVHGSSLNLKVPDLGFKGGLQPTVVLSEVLDDGLLGEGVIPTVAHARRELATPNAMVIPAAAKVWAMVVNMPPQPEPIIMPSSSSPKDSPARRWAAYDTLRPPEVKKYTSVRLDRVKFMPLTEPFPVFGFDFDAPLDDPSSVADYCREQAVQVNSIAAGCANAVVFWFTLTLNRSGETDGLADICTYPAMTEKCGASGSSRCWNQALQFVKPTIVGRAGTTLTVPCAHSPTRMTFGDIMT